MKTHAIKRRINSIYKKSFVNDDWYKDFDKYVSAVHKEFKNLIQTSSDWEDQSEIVKEIRSIVKKKKIIGIIEDPAFDQDFNIAFWIVTE